MQDRGGDRTDDVGDGKRAENHYESNTYADSLHDDATGIAGQALQEGDAVEAIVHQGDAGRADRDVTSGGAHCDGQVARGECRGIVDAVADHGDDVASLL